MSGSFPAIPGFTGPLSFKAFLTEYMGLRLTFGPDSATPSSSVVDANPSSSPPLSPQPLNEAAASPPSGSTRDIALPSNPSFLVVVYVAKHAPQPPAVSVTKKEADAWPAPMQRQRPQRNVLSSSTKKSYTSSLPCFPLTAATTWRPLTRALLQHPWWAVVAARLGPAAMAFLEAYCPVVLQLEAMAGGIQVLGPPLKDAVPSTMRVAVARRVEAVKRCREQSTCAGRDEACGAVRRRRRTGSSRSGAATAGKGASRAPPPDGGVSGGVSRTTTTAASVRKTKKSSSDSWLSMLPRCDAPRTRLFSSSVSNVVPPSLADGRAACDTEADAISVPAFSESVLQVLWLSRHPRSLCRVVRAVVPPWQAAQVERRCLGSVPGDDSAALRLPEAYVRHVFRWMEWPAAAEEAGRSNAETKGTFNVLAHLQWVLTCVLEQSSRFDLRGAALKHLHFLETRCRSQLRQRGQQPPDIQRLAAPVDVVVSYLRTLLSSLRWGDDAAATPSHSFWGTTEDGSGRVLDALCAALHAWLSASRQALFPLSRFLDGVPVAQLPWLSRFYTVARASSPSAARLAKLQRSQRQQRVWLQFVLFLTQDVLPFLLRASFTVTWSSKNTNRLLFFPAAVWRRVTRVELARMVGRAAEQGAEVGAVDAHSQSDSGTAATAGAAACGRMCRVAASAAASAVEERAASAVLRTPANAPSLLYAGVRFRPDGRKLRPIAALRSASSRSVKAMACGVPSPYSRPAAMLRILARLVLSVTVVVPPSTAGIVKWLSQQRSRPFLVAAARPPLRSSPRLLPHKAGLQRALRCLVCGVEERRIESGLPRLTNLSHQDEYAELRSFCEEARGGAQAGGSLSRAMELSEVCGGRGDAPQEPRVFLVRSDASRCYDCLPQARVLQEALALVHHTTYRTVCFADVYAAPCCVAGEAGVENVSVTRTLSLEAVTTGRLDSIPRGHVYWEEEEGGRRDTRTGDGPSACDISGDSVRALLEEHLQRHLTVLDGSLFEQRVGILQGSPVAMLLCDAVFSGTVDAALSGILSEHAERSLLLRRVDDVLVATTSAVAAQRCLRAVAAGWPEVGYTSNPSKLIVTAMGGNLVPWCGLLLHDTTLEVGVQWQRMKPLLASLLVSDTRRQRCGDGEPLFFTQRCLSVLHLRLPPTALCRRINAKARQLQTCYEAALVWSRLVLAKVQAALRVAHHRRVGVLLLRPLAACVARLQRLVRRHSAFLAARQSGTDVSAAEVRACVLTALHRTLQCRLRVLVAGVLRSIGQRHCPKRIDSGSCLQRSARYPKGKAKCKSARGSTDRVSYQGRTSGTESWRAFWWCAAREVERQWSEALASLARSPVNASNTATTEGQKSEGAATVRLLVDAGPSSLHAKALQAVQPLFAASTDGV